MTRPILVVDDDPGFLSLARRILEAAGFEVAGTAASVAEGRAAARELEARAMLVDVGLPDGSGIDLARELSELPWEPRIVLTSTDRDALVGVDADGTGVPAFVPKEELPNAPLGELFA